jgi:hypothetical protein
MTSMDGDECHPWATLIECIHGWRWMASMDDADGLHPWMAMDGIRPWVAMDSTHGQHQWVPSRATSMDAIHERH